MATTTGVPALLWAIVLKGFLTKFWVRVEVVGDFGGQLDRHPKLLLAARHASHLDGGVVQSAVPFAKWSDFRVGAAKDYFFTSRLSSAFFHHCVGAVPIDRKEQKGMTIRLCLDLLRRRDPIWLLLFPEGSRVNSGEVHFKRGLGLFSQAANVPVLFLYVEDPARLWPKGKWFPRPGRVRLHVGPVHAPAESGELEIAYDHWVKQIIFMNTIS